MAIRHQRRDKPLSENIAGIVLFESLFFFLFVMGYAIS